MKRPVRSSEPASDELTEAVRWYEARRTGLGGEFFDAVSATQLATLPPDEQDRIARWLLDQLPDDEHWTHRRRVFRERWILERTIA